MQNPELEFLKKFQLRVSTIECSCFYDILLFYSLDVHITKKTLTEKYKMYIIIRRALTRHVFVRKLS